MEIIGSLYTGTSEKFFRGLYPIARCIKSQNNDLGVVMAEIKVIGSIESEFESTNRIYDSGGVSPTLSTMQGGNQEPKIMVRMCGRNPDRPTDRTPGLPTEQRVEPNAKGISGCLKSVQKDNMVLEKANTQIPERNQGKYRIRKLTPRECGRLMGVSDEDITKMAAVNSNSQLYKQFGNSIVVDVMCEMFKNLGLGRENE